MEKFSEVSFLDIKEEKEYIKLIERVFEQAFKLEGLENTNLYVNVILTNPKNIKDINKKYRNIDKETDVLSFPMFEKEEIKDLVKDGSIVREVLGDIIISIERVKQQSIEYGHSFERELSYMVIHGFYHLMGYDHMTKEDKKQMRKKEENVLNILDIKR